MDDEMTDKPSNLTVAYMVGLERGKDLSKSRIVELEIALENLLKSHTTEMCGAGWSKKEIEENHVVVAAKAALGKNHG
jgi:hypothetical protein